MHTRRCLLLTFIESFATVCVERGVFFFAYRHLGFSEAANLWLSLAFGITYVIGALASHRVALRWSEKRLLQATMLGQLAVHLALAAFGQVTAALVVLNTLLGFIHGAKWPVIESYVSAGRNERSQARIVGVFNLSWAAAVPLALVFTGPVNTTFPAALFLVPAVINAISMALTLSLPRSPLHLEAGDPDRPTPERLAYLKNLLGAARAQLLLSYSCMWIISALIPSILSRLTVRDDLAPGISGLMDAFRFGSFAVLSAFQGWIGSRRFLWMAAIALPAGFFLVIVSRSLGMVIAGEILFGLAAGAIYFAAICYAMVVKNASVDAGGVHEAIIGGGFTFGPIVGLLAIWLTPVMQSRTAGVFVGIGPMVLVCLSIAGWFLIRSGRMCHRSPKHEHSI